VEDYFGDDQDNVDNKQKQRKIRCNSIEYDKGAQ